MDIQLALSAERFISRHRTEAKQEIQKQNDPTNIRRVLLFYVKDISELTARLLKPHGIQAAHKPASTLRKLVSNPKRPTEMSCQTHIVYKVQCTNCEKFYVDKRGGNSKTRMHKHQLAVRRHDALSLISIHEDAHYHKFDFSNVKILDRAVTKR